MGYSAHDGRTTPEIFNSRKLSNSRRIHLSSMAVSLQAPETRRQTVLGYFLIASMMGAQISCVYHLAYRTLLKLAASVPSGINKPRFSAENYPIQHHKPASSSRL